MRRGPPHANSSAHSTAIPARAPGQRQLRVGEELRHALAWILEKGDIRDPALAARPVTVTEVRVSPDLRNATAFVVPLGGGAEAEAEILEGFKRVKPFLRHELARTVKVRHVPDLSFALDDTFDIADRIEALLHRPDVARDLDGHDPEDEDEDDEYDDDGDRDGAADDGAPESGKGHGS